MTDQSGGASTSGAVSGESADRHWPMITRAALRMLAILGGLGLFYAFLPMSGFATHSIVSAIVSVCVALALFATVFGWEIRRVLVAEHPAVRSVEALFVVLALFLSSFSLIYLSLAQTDVQAFGGPLTRPQAFYFATTVLCTVGFGDIVPGTDAARLLVTVQMLLDFVLLAVIVRVFIWAAQQGIQRTTLLVDEGSPSRNRGTSE